MKTSSLLFFVLLSLAIAGATFCLGDTPWPAVWKGLLARLQGSSAEWNPLLDERLPRLLVILTTGASLAVSGAVMQSLFQNPLASPSVLGISCGGSLLVTAILFFNWHITYPFSIPIAAFSGCLLTLMLIYSLCRLKGPVQLQSLILTGIAISTLFLAIQGAITYAMRDQWQLIQTLTEWEAGSSSNRQWKHVHMQLPLALVGLFSCWYYRKEIDLLTLGEEEATNLGVDVAKVRWRLFLSVSLLTGGAIAAMGVIAFFGLVLPHILRKATGPDNSKLIPICMLIGSSTLATLDLLLRQFQIQSFSIGNISAVVGGLFFLLLLFDKESHLHERATC